MAVGKDKKNGTWYYILELGKDINGKRKQKKERFKTKKEAQAAFIKVQADFLSGNYVEPSKMLYKDYLKDWLKSKQISVKKSTIETYTWLINKHIVTNLGNIQISKLTPFHLEKLYGKLFSEGSLSDENIQKIHTLINASLKKAERQGLIKKNVASLVDRPQAHKKEINVWEQEEVYKFLEAALHDNHYITFFLAINTGMRQGEILGLRWKDVDFENRLLRVSQILSHDGKEFTPGAKTRAGMRSISLPKEAIDVLKKHKLRVAKEKLQAGSLYKDNDLVICTSIGTPVHPRNVRRSFYNIIKKAGLKRIRFHDLRHTHATLLLKNSVNPKVVAERLGHADIRMTLDTYSHILPSMQKEAADEFGKMLFGNGEHDHLIREIQAKYAANIQKSS